jgi:hypothetical protein
MVIAGFVSDWGLKNASVLKVALIPQPLLPKRATVYTQVIESSATNRDPSAFGTSPSQGEEGLLTNNEKAKFFLATKPLKAISPLRRGIIGGLTLSAITDFCVHGSPRREKGELEILFRLSSISRVPFLVELVCRHLAHLGQTTVRHWRSFLLVSKPSCRGANCYAT